MANTRPINEYLAYLLAQAERQLNRQLDQEFRAEGVPVEQWRILKLLAEESGRSLGYRRADKSDGRRVLIFISEHGRAVIQRLNRLANSHQDEIVESYGNRQA